jgi:hypothetical protein
VDLEAVHRHLGSIVAICEGAGRWRADCAVAHARALSLLTAKRSSIIQTSPSRYGHVHPSRRGAGRILQRVVLPIPTEI